MPFVPLSDKERQHYENEIKRMEKEIAQKQAVVATSQQMIKEGKWCSPPDLFTNK